MSLPRLVARLVKPVAAACLALLAVALLLTLTGDAPVNFDRYRVLHVSAAGAAAAALLVLALAPRSVTRRIGVSLLIVAGLALAVLQGNGLADGLPRLLLVVAAAGALGLAVPALIVTLESDQNRTASRF